MPLTGTPAPLVSRMVTCRWSASGWAITMVGSPRPVRSKTSLVQVGLAVPGLIRKTDSPVTPWPSVARTAGVGGVGEGTAEGAIVGCGVARWLAVAEAEARGDADAVGRLGNSPLS